MMRYDNPVAGDSDSEVTALPGITDGHQGAGPDLGACEYGGHAWKAGCDLSIPEFIDEKTP